MDRDLLMLTHRTSQVSDIANWQHDRAIQGLSLLQRPEERRGPAWRLWLLP